MARHLDERPEHRRARDAPCRAPEYIDEPWFAKGSERARHADELDEAVGTWISERTREEVVDAFEEAGAAVAPIYSIEDIMGPPVQGTRLHYHRGRPRARPREDAERPLQALRDAGGGRGSGPPWESTTKRSTESWASAKTDWTNSQKGHGMNSAGQQIRSYLYVPGDDGRRIEKALAPAPTPWSSTWKTCRPKPQGGSRETVAARTRVRARRPVFVQGKRGGNRARRRTSPRWPYATSPGCGCPRPSRSRA